MPSPRTGVGARRFRAGAEQRYRAGRLGEIRHAGGLCECDVPDAGADRRDPRGAGRRAILRGTFAECCDVAAAFGRAPRGTFHDQTIATFTDRGSSGASSMLRDMTRGNRIEADHIVGDMVARAERVNVAAPMLRTALARLKCYEAQRT